MSGENAHLINTIAVPYYTHICYETKAEYRKLHMLEMFV